MPPKREHKPKAKENKPGKIQLRRLQQDRQFDEDLRQLAKLQAQSKAFSDKSRNLYMNVRFKETMKQQFEISIFNAKKQTAQNMTKIVAQDLLRKYPQLDIPTQQSNNRRRQRQNPNDVYSWRRRQQNPPVITPVIIPPSTIVPSPVVVPSPVIVVSSSVVDPSVVSDVVVMPPVIPPVNSQANPPQESSIIPSPPHENEPNQQ